MNINKKIYFITIISVLSALSTILFFIGGIPIFIAFPYLKIDLSDIPALIGGIIVSPGAGLLIELIKNLIHMLRTHTMGIGELMSLIIGSTMIISYCFPFRWIIKKRSLKFSVAVSYITCTFFTVVIAVIANSIIYPLFLSSVTSETTIKSVMVTYLTAVIIINFIKAIVTISLSLIVIKISQIRALIDK